jgi:hypothetical protein
MNASKPRAVIIGPMASVFVERTRDALDYYGIDVKSIDIGVGDGANRGKISAVFQRFRLIIKVIREMCGFESDRTALVMSLPIDIVWLVPVLKIKFARVVGIAFGSDMLRRNRKRDRWISIGLSRLDVISATNYNVMDAMLLDFPYLREKERKVTRFGLPVFDCIDQLLMENVSPDECRTRLGYSPNRMLLVLGYAASDGQRQIELIDFFSSKLKDLPDFDFVVPLQYGSRDTARSVHEACKLANQRIGAERFYVLTSFHDRHMSAVMRIATTVLINHSVSDAFSGSVQEVVYAGNLVLAADHLPYATMPGFGTAIRTYANLEQAMSLISPQALADWTRVANEAREENRAGLSATSSWRGVLSDWLALISDGK